MSIFSHLMIHHPLHVMRSPRPLSSPPRLHAGGKAKEHVFENPVILFDAERKKEFPVFLVTMKFSFPGRLKDHEIS